MAGLPNFDPAEIDDVYWGNANGAGEENRNVARMAVLLAGLPDSVPGASLNRLCASGLEAFTVAARTIAAFSRANLAPVSFKGTSHDGAFEHDGFCPKPRCQRTICVRVGAEVGQRQRL